MKPSAFLFAAFALLSVPAAAAAAPAAPTAPAGGDDGGRAREIVDATNMVRKAFRPYPAGLLRSEILRNEDGSPMVDVADDGSVKVRVRITVPPSLYREWTKDVMQKLDAVSTTYEDGTLPCVLAKPMDSLAASASPGMGDLSPEYAAMAAQAAQMAGGMGMGYAAPAGAVHPILQMEMEKARDDPPSITLDLEELRERAGSRPDELTLCLVRPGQDAVWKGKPGDVSLRIRTYTLAGDKAVLVRSLLDEAMKPNDAKAGFVSEEKSPRPPPQTRRIGEKGVVTTFSARSGNRHRGTLLGGSDRKTVVLTVSVMSGEKAIAEKTIHPSNYVPNQMEAQDAADSGIEIVYPLSVSLVPMARFLERNGGLVVTPFLVVDSAHCYQAWEDWVPVGRLSDADLERVTDVRSKVFFR